MSEPTKEEKGGEANDAGSASVLDILANAADAKEKVDDDAVEDKVEDASASKDDDKKGKEDEVKKDDDPIKQPASADTTAAAAPGPAAASHEQPPYENPPTIPAMQQQAFVHHANQYGNMANNPQAYNPAMMMNNYPQTKAPTAHNLPQTGVRNDVPMPFPEKLMELLSNEDVSDVITWLPHGKGFAILKKNKFAAEVMPMYFNKVSKYTSFTRKLRRWGFNRVSTGIEQGAYYHKFFQRGKPLLRMQMHCQYSTPSKSGQNLHEQNKLLHEEKIAAQQQKMGGRATHDTNEGNRLSLLAQEDAAASGIPTMIPPKHVAIHLPNSQKRVPATSNVDLDEAIRRQKATLAADEAQLLGNSLDAQQQDLSRQRELLRRLMGSVGSGFDPILEKQHQLLRRNLEEAEINEAEVALLYERTKQLTQQISMSMNMMAANNDYNQYDKKDKNRQKHEAIMEEDIPEVSLDDLPKEALAKEDVEMTDAVKDSTTEEKKEEEEDKKQQSATKETGVPPAEKSPPVAANSAKPAATDNNGERKKPPPEEEKKPVAVEEKKSPPIKMPNLAPKTAGSASTASASLKMPPTPALSPSDQKMPAKPPEDSKMPAADSKMPAMPKMGGDDLPDDGIIIRTPTSRSGEVLSGAAAAQGPGMGRELKLEDALLYLEQVKLEFGDRPRIYNEFLEIMKNFKAQEVDTIGVINRVRRLFHGYNNLILGFNTFLPDGYKIEMKMGDAEPVFIGPGLAGARDAGRGGRGGRGAAFGRGRGMPQGRGMAGCGGRGSAVGRGGRGGRDTAKNMIAEELERSIIQEK